MIMGTNAQQGAVGNVVTGIIGAIIGGWIVGIFGASVSGFNLASLLVAILGAVVLLFIVRLFTGGSRHHNV